MSLEVFEKLEAKVQQAIDTITLLQMEIEELKEKNNSLSQEVQNAQHQREELERENNHLKEQQNGWQERLQALLGRMEEVLSLPCRGAARRLIFYFTAFLAESIISIACWRYLSAVSGAINAMIPTALGVSSR